MKLKSELYFKDIESHSIDRSAGETARVLEKVEEILEEWINALSGDEQIEGTIKFIIETPKYPTRH